MRELPEGLQLQADVSPADWIVERLWPREPGTTKVGRVVPEGFEAYARIFHSLNGRPWCQVMTTGRLHAAAQFHQIVGATSPDDLTERPSIGSLTEKEAEGLTSALRPVGDRGCWMAIWEGYGWLHPSSQSRLRRRSSTLSFDGPITRLRRRRDAAKMGSIPKVSTPGRDYLLMHGSIDLVTVLARWPYRQTPNILWPDDRSWCVATEIDFDSTLVGGSRACIDSVLSSPDLEALEISLDARLDWQGDTIN